MFIASKKHKNKKWTVKPQVSMWMSSPPHT